MIKIKKYFINYTGRDGIKRLFTTMASSADFALAKMIRKGILFQDTPIVK